MGVAALLIVLSVMNGFNLTIRSRLLNFEPHLVLMTPELPSLEALESLRRRIEDLAPIERMDRFEAQDIILRSQEGAFGGAIAKGYDGETIDNLLKRAMSDESLLAEAREPLAADELIVGVELARTMSLFEGDDLVMVPPETLLLPKGEVPRLQKSKVRTLLSTQVADVDSKVLLYRLDVARVQRKVLSLDTGYEIRLVNPYHADRLKPQLTKMGLKVQTWTERDTSLFYSLKMESFLMALFLTLAVVITSFSIVTVMVLLINQKRKDIGLLQAMGLSLRRTRAVFFRVGLLLSLVGIVGGMILGTTVCLVLDKYPLELLPEIYTDSTLPAKLTLRIFLFVLSSSCALAVVGSWLPVWRYVIHQPAESLRKPAGHTL